MANDCIYRDDAIETVCKNCDCAEDCKYEGIDKSCVTWRELKNHPAADVRPVVSAEWERPKGSTPRSWIFVCSKCGDRAYFPVPKYFPKGCGYSFCPNCGCAMENEK